MLFINVKNIEKKFEKDNHYQIWKKICACLYSTRGSVNHALLGCFNHLRQGCHPRLGDREVFFVQGNVGKHVYRRTASYARVASAIAHLTH